MGSVKWRGLACLLFSFVWESVSGPVAHAYVLPAEQIVQFMAANFSKTQTLVVHLHCQESGEEKAGGGSEEVLTMKSPDRVHSTIKDSDAKKGSAKEYSYQQFFLANSPSRLLTLMLEMGIDLQKVGYTRMDGVIAYRIGDPEGSSPQVLVEKGRFLPLFVSYKAPGPEETVVKAKFLDYRKAGQAWYPFEMVCPRADGVAEKCVVRSLKVNGPVSPSLFQSK
jgi:hypothetical protein